MTAKTLTIRLPAAAYERAADLARKRKQSLNRLFQDSLNLLDQQEREGELFDDFTAIADAGADEIDVGFALEAQNEATAGR
ncbi:MAG: hypothetical protein ACR2OZ_10750 [Verrucomicrobiales bacterium]